MSTNQDRQREIDGGAGDPRDIEADAADDAYRSSDTTGELERDDDGPGAEPEDPDQAPPRLSRRARHRRGRQDAEPANLVLDIDSLAFGGEGVARHEGKVRFVPGALPGERVEAMMLGRRRRFDRAKLVSVLVPAKNRRVAPCAHDPYCGGCSLLHLEYASQLEAKAKQVRDCLERIGNLDVPEVGPPLPSPTEFAYRNKMEFTFSPRAWEPERPEVPRTPGLGLHVGGRFDAVFDLESCLLPGERFTRVVRETRDFVRERGWTGYTTQNDSGLLRHLVVREGQNTGDLLVALVTRENEPGLADFGPFLAERIPGLTGVVLLVNRTRATIARGAVEDVLWGSARFEERLLDLTFELHALSFFQTNTRGAEVLVRALKSMLPPSASGRLLDLYCGAGTLGLALADRFHEVLGVEQVAEAVEDAARNAIRNGITHAKFEAGDVEERLRSVEPGTFDVVVVDPPRAGLHPRALDLLPALGPRHLIYVSCNPSTLARDGAAIAQAGYRATGLQVVDLFPQTAHVESIVRFER